MAYPTGHGKELNKMVSRRRIVACRMSFGVTDR
ncbi:hypothetical protein CCACVL1_20469 [Corchorus capsularis]|uniref:Uncharacterized protein n=1 Tax=Corchorus capsularis TaxID=210143 RepID=A0A1R3HB24_COCAP|nr:hypothetical protein CCACVL1_20469 [Corchorus capsularis]